MTKNFNYASAGVDRNIRAESKKELKILQKTYRFSRYGEIIQLPYGKIFPLGENRYLDLVIEGVGTKVLVAQLAEKFENIGIDSVAMAVNDVIRSGAKPLAIADNIHAQVSNPTLIKELMKGITQGAIEAQCIVSSGEIGDVPEIINGISPRKGFDMVIAAIGEVTREKIISGKNIKPGESIIGLQSSGLHSNGISLARKILLKKWGGKYEPHDVPDGFNREIITEVLEPTKIYVKPLLAVKKKVNIKAAVHITGDAYLKFYNLTNFSHEIGFEFNNFKSQPIFELIQKTALELAGRITDKEMFKTFNMGWGFAVIVDKANNSETIDILEKNGMHAEQIGSVTSSKGLKIFHKKKKIFLE